MKRTFFLLLTICIFAGSCGKEEVTPITEILELNRLVSSPTALPYAESLSKWKELKNEYGDNYLYQTTFQSFAGFGNITQIEVKNGVVISRKFEEYTFSNTTGLREKVDSYCEDVANLGTNNKGAVPLTIDVLYETCAREYLTVDETQNSIIFQTTDNGLMTICGYVPIFCADDCFVGVQIEGFKWLD